MLQIFCFASVLLYSKGVGMNATENKGLCNKCKELVPAHHSQKGERVYLVKTCPDCGESETLISTDARRYFSKRCLDSDGDSGSCMLNCLECRHRNPNILFVDVTNRCNLNCPICINNTPSMGMLFEPPIEYFDKIFKHFSRLNPKPSVQLFGGEPTVRKDLFDIVKMCRDYGLPTRVNTNGVKLADEEYCRDLVATRATVLISYDGSNREMYSLLRARPELLEVKEKAIDNLAKNDTAKVVIMHLVACGLNDKTLPDLYAFCHDRRNVIRGLYLMPLAETFSKDKIDVEVERITTEDLERIFNNSFPEDRIDFIPAGFLGQMATHFKSLRVKALPFLGAHPNCESLYLLVSDGKQYVPLSRYLKGTTPDLCKSLLTAEKNLIARLARFDNSKTGRFMEKLKLKKSMVFLFAFISLARVMWRNIDYRKVFKGKGLGRLWHIASLLGGLFIRSKTSRLLEKHTNFQAILQIIVLPFEDDENLETDRLKRCPAAFAFYDPAEDKVGHIPVCAWGHFKDTVMHRIVDYYKTH